MGAAKVAPASDGASVASSATARSSRGASARRPEGGPLPRPTCASRTLACIGWSSRVRRVRERDVRKVVTHIAFSSRR
jgi:Ca2+-binding EF-hand superfamily protein